MRVAFEIMVQSSPMTAIPDFSTIDFADTPVPTTRSAAAAWITPEDIPVKPVYGPGDMRGIDFLDTYPGLPPFLRDKEDMERPTAETAQYYAAHVKDADLNKAMDGASMAMIKWLESEKKVARLDAYGLASVAMDCRVGAISETEKNVHCLMPKSIWTGKGKS